LKVLFDTNVILDALYRRPPYYQAAASLMNRVEGKQLQGFLSAHSVTTIDYLTTKAYDRETATKAVRNLLALFQIAEVNQATLSLALDLPFEDYEDTVLCQAGISAGAEVLVTRNLRDFRKASLPTYSPQELLARLHKTPR